MNPLIHLARWHSSFGYHPSFSHYHSYGYSPFHGSGWISHMVISSIIHAMIYSVIFRALAHLSLSQGILIVIAIVAVLYLWNRNRGYRR